MPRAANVVGIKIVHRLARLDGAIHHRLGEARLVDLVVPWPAIADEIDENVAAELGAIGRRHARHAVDGLGVVAIDVQHRRLDQLGDVRRMPRRATFFGRSGEADLVVDDDVNRAADIEGRQAGELQHLGDEALPGEARIGVQQQRQHGASAVFAGDAIAWRGLGPAR